MNSVDERDRYRDLLGLDVSPERWRELLTDYADILEELRKLRSLDLTDIHPAVVFDPTGGTQDGQ